MRHLIYCVLLTALLPLLSPAQSVEGNVLEGWDIGLRSYSEAMPHRFYVCHVGEGNKPLRRVVVLNERWNDAPEDIVKGGGGYRLAALTEEDYAHRVANGEVWGELFQAREPVDMGCWTPDETASELIVFPLGHETDSAEVSVALEVMYYYNVVDGRRKRFLTVAENKTERADYTRRLTHGRYDTQWYFHHDGNPADPDKEMERRSKKIRIGKEL